MKLKDRYRRWLSHYAVQDRWQAYATMLFWAVMVLLTVLAIVATIMCIVHMRAEQRILDEIILQLLEEGIEP